MQIQVTHDRNIEGGERLTSFVESTMEASLSRYSDRLTRVIVHLADENSHKTSDNDKRCSIEARPAGHSPIAVTNHASNLDEAIDGAAVKMERLLEHTFGRHDNHKGKTPMGGPTG